MNEMTLEETQRLRIEALEQEKDDMLSALRSIGVSAGWVPPYAFATVLDRHDFKAMSGYYYKGQPVKRSEL